MTLSIQRCADCGRRWFPARLSCPHCGGATLLPDVVDRGRVEHTTELADGTVLAAVRCADDVPLVARLLGPVRPGDLVAITDDPHTTGPAAYVPPSTKETR